MVGFDGWDLALLLVAAYFSVTLLVRLMRDRRDQLVDGLHKQIEEERRRQQMARRRARQRDARRQQIRIHSSDQTEGSP